MSVEERLKRTIENADQLGDGFSKQISDFRAFEARLKDRGFEIEKRRFSIPLMERLGVSYIHQK